MGSSCNSPTLSQDYYIMQHRSNRNFLSYFITNPRPQQQLMNSIQSNTASKLGSYTQAGSTHRSLDTTGQSMLGGHWTHRTLL